MKADELRLNNWVKAFGGYWNIDNTDFSNLEKIETYEFVPLTEELLLKCGFVKERYYYVKLITPYKPFTLYKNNDKTWTLADCNVDSALKYLHQLQNLYFAFTQKELEISL